jgi:hypothetical protein
MGMMPFAGIKVAVYSAERNYKDEFPFMILFVPKWEKS